MATIPIFFLIIFTITFAELHGKYYNICKIGSRYRRETCENIYVWSPKLQQFQSLLNVTLNGEIVDYNSIRGETLRVLADNMLPYVVSNNSTQELGGFLGNTWKLLEEYYGFRTVVKSVHYETGLEIIASGGADIMLAAVVGKPGLLNVHYSQPYLYNWYYLYIKYPKPKASSSSYLKIFDIKLWLVMFGVFTILTITIWLTIKCLNRTYRSEPSISLPSCFLGIISGFTNQGFDLKLRSNSGRIQVLFALILGVVLYSAMNAVLVAQLAVFDIPFPFNSLDDIANKRTHSLCVRSNSFVYNNFTDRNREILPKWKGLVNGRYCLDINNQTNLARILCNDHLVILESRVVMQIILKYYSIPCHIINHSDRLFIKANSFLMVKNFKHKKLINCMMHRFYTTGILKRLEYKWVLPLKIVNLNQDDMPQVTFDHISGVLIFYTAMFLISCLILICEILHYKYTTCKHPVLNEQFYN